MQTKHQHRPADTTWETGGYDGSPMKEVLERMRRLETRVTNTMRATGLVPHAHAPDARQGTVTYSEEALAGQIHRTLHVSSPNVAIAEISRVAVNNAPRGCDTLMHIVLCNQPWGQMVVHGETHNPQGTAS